MIKINYKNPEPTESKDDVSISNILISDKFKKGDYLEMSCISWLKIDSKRDYQDLEQLLRYLDTDVHIIACPQPIQTIPDGLEIGYPNGGIITEQLEYVVKFSSRPKEDALKELLLIHSSYEENFECLKKAGCFMVKNQDQKKNVSNIKGVEEIKQVLESGLKLDFTYFKPMESINFIIEDLITKYGKRPEQIACGEINGNKVYALMLDGEIASPIGWMEKNINLSDSGESCESDKLINMTTNMTIDITNSKVDIDYELIDFRAIKVEKV